MATLQPAMYADRPIYERPAGVAAVGTLLIAIAIGAKIWREHSKYAKTKTVQNAVGEALNASCDAKVIPDGMLKEAGKGFIWSIAVVIVAAIGAILFCVSVVGHGPYWY